MKLNKLRVFCIIATTVVLSFVNTTYAQKNNPQVALEQLMQRHHGKVIYVDFWASWCAPCRQSFPWMNDMQKKYKAQDFVVVSINVDAKRALANKFLNEVSADFAVIYDNRGVLAKKFQLKGMPSSYLFDRQGQLISAHNGFNDKKKQLFEQEIIQALH